MIGVPHIVRQVFGREILPGVWHWRVNVKPNSLYLIEGWKARTSDEVRYAMRKPETVVIKYSYVDTPADPDFVP